MKAEMALIDTFARMAAAGVPAWARAVLADYLLQIEYVAHATYSTRWLPGGDDIPESMAGVVRLAPIIG